MYAGDQAADGAKASLKLKTVAVTVNKHEIWEMKRFAEEELGLEFKFDAMMNPRIDCSQSPLTVRLSAEEAVLLDLQDPNRIEEWKQFGSISTVRCTAPGTKARFITAAAA